MLYASKLKPMKKTIILVSLLTLCAYLLGTSLAHLKETKEYCGKIITKEVFPEYSSKHGSYQGTKHCMIIKFNDIGYQTLEVSTNTYYTHKDGEMICFDLQRSTYEDIHGNWWAVAMILNGCVIFFLLIVISDHFISSKEKSNS